MYTKTHSHKLVVAVSILIIVTLACSVGTSAPTQHPSQGGQVQEESTSVPQGTSVPFQTNTPASTASPTPVPIGLSRTNPYPQSEVITTSDWEVRVLETKRGDQAWQDLKAANMFNMTPPDNMEYILVKLHVKNISNDSEEHSIGECDFGITGSQKINYTCAMVVIVAPEPQLDGKLYSGGEIEGWAGYLMFKGETNLILVMNETNNSDQDPVRYIALDEGASVSISSDLAGIQPTSLGTSRENPAKLNEKVTTEDWEIAVIETVRGDAAWQMIKDANEYNDPPAEGMEYIAVKIHMRYIGTAEKSDRMEDFSFSATGSKNVLYEYKYVSGPYPSISISLFPGGEAEGWTVVQVAQGETGIILVFQPWLNFNDEDRRYISLEQ
jgi:hypothetical protein